MGRTDPPTAVVLLPDPDHTSTALGVVRCLGREDVPIVTASSARTPMSALSRYVSEHIVLPPMRDDAASYVDALVDRAGRSNEPAVLFLSSDEHCIVVNSFRDKLSPHFAFSYLDDETLGKCIDKNAMFRSAIDAEVPIPETAIVASEEDADQALRMMGFPCILKPVSWVHFDGDDQRCTRDSNFMKAFHQKAVRAGSRSELTSMMEMAISIGVPVVVQEEIIGDCTTIWMVSIYADGAGNVWTTPALQKTRQYPSDFGIASCITSPNGPDIGALARDLVQSMGFTGIADVEFKKHHITGEYCLMELNPRPATWASAAAANGVNIPYIAYCDLAGLQLPDSDAPDVRLTWVDSWYDTMYFLRYRKGDHTGRSLSWKEWRRSLRRPREGAYFTTDDPLPGLRRAWDLGCTLAGAGWRRIARRLNR